MWVTTAGRGGADRRVRGRRSRSTPSWPGRPAVRKPEPTGGQDRHGPAGGGDLAGRGAGQLGGAAGGPGGTVGQQVDDLGGGRLVLGVRVRVGAALHLLGGVGQRHGLPALDRQQLLVELPRPRTPGPGAAPACPSPGSAAAGRGRPSRGRCRAPRCGRLVSTDSCIAVAMAITQPRGGTDSSAADLDDDRGVAHLLLAVGRRPSAVRRPGRSGRPRRSRRCRPAGCRRSPPRPPRKNALTAPPQQSSARRRDQRDEQADPATGPAWRGGRGISVAAVTPAPSPRRRPASARRARPAAARSRPESTGTVTSTNPSPRGISVEVAGDPVGRHADRVDAGQLVGQLLGGVGQQAGVPLVGGDAAVVAARPRRTPGRPPAASRCRGWSPGPGGGSGEVSPSSPAVGSTVTSGRSGRAEQRRAVRRARRPAWPTPTMPITTTASSTATPYRDRRTRLTNSSHRPPHPAHLASARTRGVGWAGDGDVTGVRPVDRVAGRAVRHVRLGPLGRRAAARTGCRPGRRAGARRCAGSTPSGRPPGWARRRQRRGVRRAPDPPGGPPGARCPARPRPAGACRPAARPVPPGSATLSLAASRMSRKNRRCQEPAEVTAALPSLPPSWVIRRYGRSSSQPTTPHSQTSTTWSQPGRVGVLMIRSTANR